jgi:hypothetical protein
MGLATSVVFATTFISLNAEVSKSDQAMAVSTLFCLYGIGTAVGTSASKVVMDSTLRRTLLNRLDGNDPNTPKVRG